MLQKALGSPSVIPSEARNPRISSQDDTDHRPITSTFVILRGANEEPPVSRDQPCTNPIEVLQKHSIARCERASPRLLSTYKSTKDSDPGRWKWDSHSPTPHFFHRNAVKPPLPLTAILSNTSICRLLTSGLLNLYQ